MTLAPIDRGSAHQRATEFARRGPWGGLLCAVWKLNKTTEAGSQGSNTPMGPWPGEFTIIISSLRAFRRARDSEAKGRVDWKRSRWPDAKFEVAGAKCALRNDPSPAQSFARSLTHSLAREKREERDRGSRPRKTTTTRRREKREERREKSEVRREKRGGWRE